MKIIKKICSILLIGSALFSLQGCDQLKEKISDLFATKTGQQVVDSANQKIAAHQYKEALAELESYRKSDPAYEGQLAWAGARASFQMGENDKGYAYLAKALKANSDLAQMAMMEPLFEPVRNEIQFVTILTETSSTPASSTASKDANVENEVSIKMNSNGGIEVKAGSASAKIQ